MAQKEREAGMAYSTVPETIPNTGIIEIRPYATKVFGDAKYTGHFTKNQKRGPDSWNFIGKTITVPGLGMVLNMSDENQRLTYEILTQSDIRNEFLCPKPGSRGGNQRFYLKDIQSNAEAYLKVRETRIEVESFIKALKEAELLRFALVFGVEGTEQVVRSQLYKMADDPTTQKNMQKIIHNSDRQLLEMMAVAKKHGKVHEKKGLYRGAGDIYLWNDLVLGAGEESVIAFLKDPKNDSVYKAMKKLYIDSI